MTGIQPLRPGDPAAVGGYRLLGRLGAGGMGVVYLARSPGGATAALKVIRAEYAADPGFRARFRREAEAAGRLTGRWVVPVVAAEPGEREPWLATDFVPGPSLAQAVAAYGPLPPATVRVLGARLAEALTEVHGAGLVHRDVKPGNVLLALDGPRLIDFGIARLSGATALTASDAVIGSPGYLSPEQVRAGTGEPGPHSDVFSLGGVLAYAVTGRRPFGTGSAAAVLFRTVHEEPDLDGAPADLLPLLARCLAKDPAARPSAAEAGEELEPGPDARGPGQERWLPAALTRLVAESSAAVLALPDPPAGPADAPERHGPDVPAPDAPPERTAPAPAGPSRRRLLTLASAAGTLAAGGGLAAWAAARHRGGGSGGSGPLPRHVIGLHADLTGPLRAAGRAQERGVRLAVADHNARTGRPFDLALRVLDDAGTAKRAARVAAEFAGDSEVLAVIGPTGGAGIDAVVARCEKALLPLVPVSCATLTPGAGADRVLFRLRPDEDALTVAFVDHLARVTGDRAVAVVDDAAAGRAGQRLAVDLADDLPGRTTTHTVPADSDGFTAVAAAVRAAGADAVVYCGDSPRRAARCARALADVGFEGTRMAREPVLQAEFVDQAGAAADGWVVVTTYVDPAVLPAAKGFVAAYRERYGVRAVAPFAVEAYDAVNFLARGIRELAATGVERGAMVRRLPDVTYKGLAKTIAFDDTTSAFVFTRGLFLYRVRNGAPRYLGRYDEVARA